MARRFLLVAALVVLPGGMVMLLAMLAAALWKRAHGRYLRRGTGVPAETQALSRAAPAAEVPTVTVA